MKKIKFSQLKSNGQFLLLLTNAFLLLMILANFGIAKSTNHDSAEIVSTDKKVDESKNDNITITKKELNENVGSSTNFSEPIIGEIAIFAGNFAPRGWALCNGQLLSIDRNSSLFSILGTTYGGDGRTTFGLPDLRGRIPIHAGQGPGLPNVKLGQRGSSSYMMPYFDDKYNPVLPPSTQAVNYIIALNGIYPSRS